MASISSGQSKCDNGEVVKRHVGFPKNEKSASHDPCILIGQMQKSTSESCRKDVKKSHKLIRNFVQGATVRHVALQ